MKTSKELFAALALLLCEREFTNPLTGSAIKSLKEINGFGFTSSEFFQVLDTDRKNAKTKTRMICEKEEYLKLAMKIVGLLFDKDVIKHYEAKMLIDTISSYESVKACHLVHVKVMSLMNKDASRMYIDLLDQGMSIDEAKDQVLAKYKKSK